MKKYKTNALKFLSFWQEFSRVYNLFPPPWGQNSTPLEPKHTVIETPTPHAK